MRPSVTPPSGASSPTKPSPPWARPMRRRTGPPGSGTRWIWPGRTKDAALGGSRCYSGSTPSWGSMALATWPTAEAMANVTRRQALSACNTSPVLASKPSPGCPTPAPGRLIPTNGRTKALDRADCGASEREVRPRLSAISLAGDGPSGSHRQYGGQLAATVTNQRSTTADPRVPARAGSAAGLSPSVQRVAPGRFAEATHQTLHASRTPSLRLRTAPCPCGDPSWPTSPYAIVAHECHPVRRRFTHRRAGLPQSDEVERPTRRTTLAPWGRSTRLAWVIGGADGAPRARHTGLPARQV